MSYDPDRPSPGRKAFGSLASDEEQFFRVSPEKRDARHLGVILGISLALWIVLNLLQVVLKPEAVLMVSHLLGMGAVLVATIVTIWLARFLVRSGYVLDAIYVQLLVVGVVIFGFALFYHNGDGIRDCSCSPSGIGFLDTLYFSIVSMSTLGYGDLQPKSDFRLFAAAEGLIGMINLGLLVALFLQFHPRRKRPNGWIDRTFGPLSGVD